LTNKNVEMACRMDYLFDWSVCGPKRRLGVWINHSSDYSLQIQVHLLLFSLSHTLLHLS